MTEWTSLKLRSRALVGFHRLGIVLAAPLLVTAVTLAVMQWRAPTGPLTMIVPEGTLAWGFGDDLDDAGKQIMDEQRRAGFNAPDGMMIVGLPLGNVRHENADWTKWLLPDGREIGIASTDSKRSDEIARRFLLAEKKAGRLFTDKTVPVSIDGVQVTYLNLFDRFSPAQSPWLHKQRDWMPALAALCVGFAAYITMCAIGWVIDGFVGSHPRA
jgi:hypothetical protein